MKKSIASATGAAAASESETAILKQVGQTLSSHNRIALLRSQNKTILSRSFAVSHATKARVHIHRTQYTARDASQSYC